MATVTLHVYDIANTENENLNSFLKFVNNVSREVRAGGIYHGAIEAYGYEWSFGYCPNGSGMYRMKPMENKMYTFRESLPLGETPLSQTQFQSVLKQLQAEYQGSTYDLLTRNCCHFCEELSERLSCEPIPGWLNRFAYGADVTLTATNSAYSWMKGCADSTVTLWRGMTAAGPAIEGLPSAEQVSDKKAEREQLINTSKPTFAVPSDFSDE